MKNSISMRRKIVVFLSIMYSLVLVAQYPVNLQASLNGMATPYLSDYASNNKLNITATLNDPTTLSLPIELRFVIAGSGKRIENPITFHPITPITLTQFVALPVWGYQIQENLDANNLQFSGLDKTTYLQKKCLPEDVYTIQLQAFKWGTNIAVSQVAEIPGLWITESDPPQLNMPMDKSGVQAYLPQNILFSWTPMHIDAPGSFTDYKLELWEVIQNRNPNEVVLNTKPLWTKTVNSQLIYNYGVMETQLDTGKTYAWRIQALDRDGKSYFKNNGYSPVWTFKYLPESQMPYIVPPTNLKAEEIETESAKLTWDVEPKYQGYRVEYRKTSGGKWHSQETEETKIYARNLEPKTKYEAKIQGKNGDFYGNYSSKIEFTTKEKIALKCGENPLIPTRPSMPPLAMAEKGMLIHVGLFDMVLTEVSGGGGTYSGKGLLSFPYIINLAKGFAGANGKVPNADKNDCNGCFAVVFNSIGIDVERHLTSGEVHVVTTGFKAFVEKEMAEKYKQPMSNSPSTTPAPIDLTCNFPIGSEKGIKLDPATGNLEIKDADGEKHSYKIDKTKPTTTIKDSKGDTYKIDNKTGKVTPMGSQAPATGPNAPPSLAQTSSIDATLATVVWSNDVDGAQGGLDLGTTKEIAEAFKSKYAPAILNSNVSNLASNYAPFKAVEANGIDKIKATITINSPQLNKDSIRFITLSGAILNATKSGNSYEITLNGLDHAKMELVAVQAKDLQSKWQVIGKLIQRNYKEENRNLTLIPLGNATISNKSEIEAELKKQYGVANGNWTVNVADALPLPTGWKDKTTIDIDAGALSCYSAEMKEIIRAYNSKVGITEPKKEDYYIFVSNIPSKNTAVEGEMPRGEHYGFIFSPNPKPTTVAHELGHGAYFYEHMWDEVKGAQKGSTSNIMDYTSNPTDLRVFQWDDIHERPADFISPCWKSDEAGQMSSNVDDVLKKIDELSKTYGNVYAVAHVIPMSETKINEGITISSKEFPNIVFQKEYHNKITNTYTIMVYVKKGGKDSINLNTKALSGDFRDMIKNVLSIPKEKLPYLAILKPKEKAVIDVFECKIPDNNLTNIAKSAITDNKYDTYHKVLFSSLNNCNKRTIAIFVNGYVPLEELINKDINGEALTFNLKPEKKDYWEGIDDLFMERLGTANAYYADGSEDISTANQNLEMGRDYARNFQVLGKIKTLNYDFLKLSSSDLDLLSADIKMLDEKYFKSIHSAVSCGTIQRTVAHMLKEKIIALFANQETKTEEVIDKEAEEVQNEYEKSNFSFTTYVESLIKYPNKKKLYRCLVELKSFLKKTAQSNSQTCTHLKISNDLGFKKRMENGVQTANDFINKVKNGSIPMTKVGSKFVDEIDVISHSMGFAHSLGMIQKLQEAGFKIGRVYALAPENPCSKEASVPSDIEEFWQYGTDESKTPLIKQDGVAHQCPVKGGEKLRAYIPDEVPQGWFLSHSIGNYGWIFNVLRSTDPGFVKLRK